MKIHSLFSPSSAEKWFNCPASLSMEMDLSSISFCKETQEGTIAHKIAEKVLKNRLNIEKKSKKNFFIKKKVYASDYIKYKFFSKQITKSIFSITEEMTSYIQRYIDKVWIMSINKELLIEKKVHFSKFINISNQFGTVDAIIISPKEIQIHDLKYGFTKIEAKKNKQLQLYALGVLNKFNSKKFFFDNIRICIHQPRLNNFSEWKTTVKDLLFFSEYAKFAAQYASFAINIKNYKGINYLNKNMFNPGFKQCRWCKASGGNCKEETLFHLKKFSGNKKIKRIELFNVQKKINQLTLEELSFLYKKSNELRKFIFSIRNRVFLELKKGNTISGLKLIKNKNYNLSWMDENIAEIILKKIIPFKKRYIKKLISPSQVRKLIINKLPNVWSKIEVFIKKSKANRIISTK